MQLSAEVADVLLLPHVVSHHETQYPEAVLIWKIAQSVRGTE